MSGTTPPGVVEDGDRASAASGHRALDGLAVELTNARSQRVRGVRGLAERSARNRHGRFLVEGPQGVREALRGAVHDDVPVLELYVTALAADRYPEVLADAATAGVPVQLGSPEVLAAMSPDAQGLLAVLEVWHADLGDVLASGPRLVAVMAQVRDPGNAGTVVRAADAAGADAVVLTAGSVDVHNPKVVRSTAGSLFHLPVVTARTLAEVTDAARAAGLTVLAADGSGEHDLDDLLDVAGRVDRPGVPDLAAPTMWVLGNEAWGLPEADRALADAVVGVPLRGGAESLNVAGAATLCLYASARAQR